MDYNFATEQSDYAEEYWVDNDISEEDFVLLHLTIALDTINSSTDKLGDAGKKAASAIENVIDKYFSTKE